MSADPEVMVKHYQMLNATMGKFNVVVSGLTRVIDKNIRAQTKVIAMASKTKGMMLGVVADLELMGGAFGKVKTALANIFQPIDKSTPKLFKYGQSLFTLSGAYSNLLSPMAKMIMGSKKRVAAIHAENAAKAKATDLTKAQISGMSQINLRSGKLSGVLSKKRAMELQVRKVVPGTGMVGKAFWQPKPGKAPASMMGLQPKLGLKPFKELNKPGAFKNLRELGSNKMKGAMKHWKKNVTTPIKQIAAGGIGLGFQTTIVMGLMQAFSSLFTIFQPVIDVVGALVERVSVGFMPLIEMLVEILTSEPVLAMIDMLAQVLAEVFEMFRPLVPIIIELIQMAMKPLFKILEGIMPIIKIVATLIGTLIVAFMPLIDLLLGVLGPVIEYLVKVFLLLVVLGMYPLIFAIWLIGAAIAVLIDIFMNIVTLGTHGWKNTDAWNSMFAPIFGALNSATGEIIGTFHTGTDYVPQTGIYELQRGESVQTVEENRAGGRSQPIVINIYGSYLGADMEDLSNIIAKKLSLHGF